MNYLVGLLLLVFKSADVAFRCLVVMMNRFKIYDLFNEQLPNLKLYFYQIDSLVSLVDPALESHMKEEGLSSTLFASKWFVTLFTNV